jgi:hypothetical protein
VTGKVKNISIGRISVLINPSTNAATNAVVKLSICTDCKIKGKTNKAMVLINQISSKRIIDPKSEKGKWIPAYTGIHSIYKHNEQINNDIALACMDRLA